MWERVDSTLELRAFGREEVALQFRAFGREEVLSPTQREGGGAQEKYGAKHPTMKGVQPPLWHHSVHVRPRPRSRTKIIGGKL